MNEQLPEMEPEPDWKIKISPQTPEGRENVRLAYEQWKKYLLQVCKRELIAKGYSHDRAFDISDEIVGDMFASMMASTQTPDMTAAKHYIKAYLLNALHGAMRHYFEKVYAENRIPESSLKSISPADPGKKTAYSNLPVQPKVDINNLSDKKLIGEAIKFLPPKLAQLVELRLEDRDRFEIAKLVGLNPTQVQTKLNQAYRLMRNKLRDK